MAGLGQGLPGGVGMETEALDDEARTATANVKDVEINRLVSRPDGVRNVAAIRRPDEFADREIALNDGGRLNHGKVELTVRRGDVQRVEKDRLALGVRAVGASDVSEYCSIRGPTKLVWGGLGGNGQFREGSVEGDGVQGRPPARRIHLQQDFIRVWPPCNLTDVVVLKCPHLPHPRSVNVADEQLIGPVIGGPINGKRNHASIGGEATWGVARQAGCFAGGCTDCIKPVGCAYEELLTAWQPLDSEGLQ